ncbi:MAG: nucleotide exchange factor GrpE [Vicinamibacteria bacterium]
MSKPKDSPISPEEMAPSEPDQNDGSTQDPSSTPADPLILLEQEVASLKDQLLRRRAEFANYQRREDKDRRTANEDAVIALLSDLLPSIDSLEKALAAKGTLAEIRAGVEITLKDLSSTLLNKGITQEDPTGQKFDPLRHQALSYEPVPGAEDGTVVACYRKGFMMGDRLIRPALVKVAQQATEESPSVIVPVSH